MLVALDYYYITNYWYPAPTKGEFRAVICRSSGQSATSAKELLNTAAS